MLIWTDMFDSLRNGKVFAHKILNGLFTRFHYSHQWPYCVLCRFIYFHMRLLKHSCTEEICISVIALGQKICWDNQKSIAVTQRSTGVLRSPSTDFIPLASRETYSFLIVFLRAFSKMFNYFVFFIFMCTTVTHWSAYHHLASETSTVFVQAVCIRGWTSQGWRIVFFFFFGLNFSVFLRTQGRVVNLIKYLLDITITFFLLHFSQQGWISIVKCKARHLSPFNFSMHGQNISL